jgi:hypothetical protein
MLFPIANDAIQIDAGTPAAEDQFSNGIRLKADASSAYGATSGDAQVQNGILLNADGAVIYVDATSGLPANTQYVNGLPIAPTGALCISTDAVDEWQNGIPFAANGSVAAVIIGGGGGGDPFWADVNFMTMWQGTNGGTDAVDLSNFAKTITYQNGAVLSNTWAATGTTSLALDGTNDYASIPLSWNANTMTNWTLDGYSRFSTNTPRALLSAGPNASNGSQFYLDFVSQTIYFGDGVTNFFTYLWPLGINTAFHWALVKSSALGRITFYLDGINRGFTTSNVASNALANMMFGARPDESKFNSGFNGAARVTFYQARWEADFTPPTLPYPTS